jgi:Flp pilus assembly pilin Flp
MELFKRLIVEEDGQGLVEYTLIVLLVALVFWVAVRQSNVGLELSNSWNKIKDCLSDPTGCTAAGAGS